MVCFLTSVVIFGMQFQLPDNFSFVRISFDKWTLSDGSVQDFQFASFNCELERGTEAQ